MRLSRHLRALCLLMTTPLVFSEIVIPVQLPDGQLISQHTARGSRISDISVGVAGPTLNYASARLCRKAWEPTRKQRLQQLRQEFLLIRQQFPLEQSNRTFQQLLDSAGRACRYWPLDPDLLQVYPRWDIELSEGDSLVFPAHSTDITVTGAVQAPFRYAAAEISEPEVLMNLIILDEAADRDYGVALLPGGTQQRIGLAAWNTERLTLPPGTLLYIPLKAQSENDLISGFNRGMLKLLADTLPSGPAQ